MVENGKPWSFSPWAKIQETKAQQCAASLIGMFLNDKFKTIQCFICSNNNNNSTVAINQRKWIEFKWTKRCDVVMWKMVVYGPNYRRIIVYVSQPGMFSKNKLIREEIRYASIGGYLTKFNMSRLCSEVQPLALLYTILTEKYPFNVPFIEKRYPFTYLL